MPVDAAGRPRFTIVLTGYDRAQVDAYLAQLPHVPHPAGPPPRFDRRLRGYEITQVDAHVRQLLSGDGTRPAVPGGTPAAPKFSIVLRGYERTEVDRFLTNAQRRIADLEATVARLTTEPEDADPG